MRNANDSGYSKALEAHGTGTALGDPTEVEAAAVAFEQAIEIKPELSEAHYNLGITYREMGDLKNAEASYKMALKFNPKFPFVCIPCE